MAGIAVSASTGVMNSLLSKLSTLLSDKYNLLKGVRRDIEFLNGELLDMNAALQKLTDMEKLDGQNKVWRDKIREMAYDIEDCIDIFMHHHDSNDKADGLFHKTARKIRKLRVRYRIATEIQKLKARVVEQSQSRDRYKIEESTSKIKAVEVDPRLPALFEESKRLVGIDVPREKIAKLLMEEGDSDSGQRKVVSIVGFGGLGKTTLAKHVYEVIKDNFECKAFVSVSRSPDIPKVLKGILSGDGLSCMEATDDWEKLIQILRAELANKRYLIVIDDLWSINAWNRIESALVKNNNGSRVITTTRNHEVADTCCTGFPEHVYHMEPLSDLHSRWLFFKRVFDTEDSCPQEFREISADMLRKCKGVPLAINSIASLLAIKRRHVDTWEKILKSLGSELDTNHNLEWISHVLNLSYNDLDPELKTCFLYLGTYPEDDVIYQSDLLKKWIAEGFIRERRGLELEEAAESRFNELINRSMIEPLYSYSDEKVLGCRVHDLMLDLIISKCREENFITIIDGQFISMNEASQARRISHQSGNRDIAQAVERMSGPHVRSYISFPAADCIPPLSKFEHLRILDMMGRYSDPENMCVDLSAINQLFLLRYLKISGFRLKLPKKFGELKHLMTLDISDAHLYPCNNQSSDFTSLSSLRVLCAPGQGVVLMRNGLRKLCSLCTLWNFDIRANSVECIRDLGELTNLRELALRGSCSTSRGEILAPSLEKLGNSNLRRLSWFGRGISTQFWSNCFTCPRHLQNFFACCSMPKIPKWMAHAERLAFLHLLEVEELQNDDVQVLAQLPCLVYLCLVPRTLPEKHIIIHPNTFPRLKGFSFRCEPSSLMTFEKDAMPQLQDMRIDFCLDGQGSAVEIQDGSPVAEVEHLASLREISLVVFAKRSQRSKMESACRDAINKHPRSDAMQIRVNCTEIDENGRVIYQTSSEEDS